MFFIDILLHAWGLVFGVILGAVIGWGISMLVWGEPHAEMISTLAVVIGIVGAVVQVWVHIDSKGNK